MNFGYRLRKYAKEHHGGVSKLAEKLGIHQPQLSQYIAEQKEPKREFFIKLAQLGCDLNWLFFGEKSNFQNNSSTNFENQNQNSEKENSILEIEYLKKALEDKENIIREKERLIQILLKKNSFNKVETN